MTTSKKKGNLIVFSLLIALVVGALIGFIGAVVFSIASPDSGILEEYIYGHLAAIIVTIIVLSLIFAVFTIFKAKLFKRLTGVAESSLNDLGKKMVTLLEVAVEGDKQKLTNAETKESLKLIVNYFVGGYIFNLLYRTMFGLFAGLLAFSGTFLLLKQNEIMRLEVAQQQLSLPDLFRNKLKSDRYLGEEAILKLNGASCKEENSGNGFKPVYKGVNVEISLNLSKGMKVKRVSNYGAEYLAKVSKQTQLTKLAESTVELLLNDKASDVVAGALLLKDNLKILEDRESDDRVDVFFRNIIIEKFLFNNLSNHDLYIHNSFMKFNCYECDNMMIAPGGGVIDMLPHFLYSDNNIQFWPTESILRFEDPTGDIEDFCSPTDTDDQCYSKLKKMVKLLDDSILDSDDSIIIMNTEMDPVNLRDMKIIERLQSLYNNEEVGSADVFVSDWSFINHVLKNPGYCTNKTNGRIKCRGYIGSQERDIVTACNDNAFGLEFGDR